MFRPIKPLYELLRLLFSANASLDAWLKLSDYPKIQDLIDALPSSQVPREQYIMAVVEQLQAHKLDEERLFDRLMEERPAQREDIENARKDYFISGDFGKQVDIVVAGLTEASKQVIDASVKQALVRSETTLTKLADGADTLSIYKNLHECLHQLQKISLRRLAAAAENLKNGANQPGVLNAYRDKLASALTKAITFNRDLIDDTARSLEAEWIDKLATASHDFGAALRSADKRGTLAALELVRDILRLEPFRINRNINVTARSLPLADLTKALTEVSAAVEPGKLELSDAIRVIGTLQETLRQRVDEHKMWQNAENRIWYAEEAFGRSSPRADFASAWPAAKASVEPLLKLESNADWSESAAEFATAVADKLADETASNEALEKVFDVYLKEVRERFLEVDDDLRTDCTALASIGRPLRTLLKGL
jgi:hypothetical protein